ncbi:MAG: nucleotidyltransferase family protein, partial [Clostridia bacterium]|nr:nucleotidyltransferase family protein [Clostridia bacterium]
MITVAVVAEFNPFHNGHMYLFSKIREKFGQDAAIITVMSGNFTQRGELAVADKLIRGKIAVECGASLVLELPFPFSSSSAEFFCDAAVSLILSLGIADYLVFGSECGDLDTLVRVSDKLFSDKTEQAFRGALRHTGYAKAKECVFTSLFPEEDVTLLRSPNNMLALGYIRALKKYRASCLPYTFTRKGSYNGTPEKGFAGASYLRTCFRENDWEKASRYIPEKALSLLKEAAEDKMFPVFTDRLSSAFLSFFRLHPVPPSTGIATAESGLYAKLVSSAKFSTLEDAVKNTVGKTYSYATVNRGILY